MRGFHQAKRFGDETWRWSTRDRAGEHAAACRRVAALACVAIGALLSVPGSARHVAADWPMYRADPSRSAHAQEPLKLPLAAIWTHQDSHAPRPAWPRSRRMQFDRAFHVVALGDRVLFGSSVDGTVTALDLASGKVAWRFFTDGPLRFAPALWRDRAFVASDDGYLYALRLSDGSLLWKCRGGPGDESVLGNQVIISKWPARGGPVVADGVVYFAAGIWPSDGVHLFALDADSGRELWHNGDSGFIHMPQPHGGAEASSGVSAQGYLVVSNDHLFVPTGRAVPAAFDRRTGEFEYFRLQRYGHNGGAFAMAIGDVLFNGGLGFDTGTGESLIKVNAGQLAASKDGVVCAFGKKIAGYSWREKEKPDRKGKPVKVKTLAAQWSADIDTDPVAIITAGHQVIVGGKNRVDMFDAMLRRIVWSGDVDGVAYGLAVANQTLLVSTDRGTITCFAPSSTTKPVRKQVVPPAPSYPENARLAEAAEQIIKLGGVTRGYCLDLGCGNGALAYELAKRTRLRIIAVDPDLEKVQQARQMLSRLGLYGDRIVVLQRELAATNLPNYFADLIVSTRSLAKDAGRKTAAEARRLQRPYGGVICIGRQGELKTSVRGPLEGAGNWTHQYANPANTVNSEDRLVKGRLGMLWFRDVDFDIPSRHGRGPAPLFQEGRVFHEGLDGIVAVSAYNGRELWRYDIPNVLRAYNGDELMGVAGTGSNFCLGGDSVYVRDADRCLRLDAATGTLVGEFRPPTGRDGSRDPWGYIAWVDGLLFGSAANREHVVTYRYVNRGGDMTKQLTESKSLFAIDTKSGKNLWRYDARDSIRHNTIAIADGKVLLIDRPLAMFDRVKRSKKKAKENRHPFGRLVALDMRTGTQLWQNDREIFGTLLAVSADHGVVLMSYQPTRFRLDSEVGGRMAAFRIEDGQPLWDIKANYASRPMVNDRTIFTQGGAWDLLTGKPVTFEFKRSYGCGILASSKHMMLFRSATLGYFDLSGAKSTENYGGIRPGCWINALPAGGIVLLPDATAGCVCSYLNRAWVALEPQ